jgi:hypothetical protein
MQEYSGKMSMITEGLAAQISNPKVKQKFQLAAADVNRGFKQKLVMHTTGQVEKIKEQAFTGSLATATRMAGEGDLDGALKHFTPMLGAAIAEKGLVGDAAAAFARETMGAVYSANISKLLDSDRPLEAKAALEAGKGLMTDKQIAGFSKQIKSDVAWVRGDDMVRSLMAEGKTTSEIEAAVSAEAKKTGDKSFYDSAYHTLGNITAVRTKTYAENADKAQDEINRGKPWSKIRSKWLDSMDPSVVAAFDQRAKALAKEGSVKTDFEAYYGLTKMSPEEFAKVDLRTYAAKLSEGNLRELADRQGKILNKDEKAIRDTVTLSQQLSTAHNLLGLGDGSRKKKGMFDEYVITNVRAAEKAKGDKPLTDDEREVIIKRGMIKSSGIFGGTLYAEVAGTPAAEKFEPEIPKADRDAIVAVFKRKENRQPTGAEIMQKYKTINGIK